MHTPPLPQISSSQSDHTHPLGRIEHVEPVSFESQQGWGVHETQNRLCSSDDADGDDGSGGDGGDGDDSSGGDGGDGDDGSGDDGTCSDDGD